MKRKKPNYAYKSKILNAQVNNESFVRIVNKINLSLSFPNNVRSISHKQVEEYFEMIKENGFTEEDIVEADKINKANAKKVRYLKDKISEMIKSPCLFLTCTFTDKVFETTNEDTRKRYVRRFLASYKTHYIANVDYGKKNHREHYHAIIQLDRVNPKDYKYGNLDFEKVYISSDTTKLAKYVSKLVNHAIKETTKQCRIIYDRIKDK